MRSGKAAGFGGAGDLRSSPVCGLAGHWCARGHGACRFCGVAVSIEGKVAIGISLVLFCTYATWLALAGPSLDRAQDKFEHSATKWPAPEDFDAWRASGALKCRDHKQLRICEATWSLFSPTDGKPFGKDRVTFACSVEECAWVDP